MSLRIFHMIFITVCILLTIFVGVWGVRSYFERGDQSGLALAAVFLAGGVVLAEYGRRVFRKLRELQ